MHDQLLRPVGIKRALDAVAACRERCWRRDWIIDLDVQKFFDSVPWDLVIKAVEANTDLPWVVLYVRRWLAAPLQLPDGILAERDRGTPQGSAISPVLANLFLHYAFDTWMAREYPDVAFERYADDAVVHCESQQQAQGVLAAIANRMAQVGLRCIPTRPRWCTARTEAGAARTSTRRLPSWASPSAPARHAAGLARTSPASCRNQQGRPEEDQRRSPPMAAAPPDQAQLRRARTSDQSDRAGLDAVLRGVLQLRAASLPGAHQCLPDALDPQEIQAAATLPQGPGVLAAHHPPIPRLFVHWTRVRTAW